jgi:hypothetical protein
LPRRASSPVAKLYHFEDENAYYAIERGLGFRYWCLMKDAGRLWYVYDGVPVLVMHDFGRKANHDSFRGALENFLDGWAVGAPNWGMRRGRNWRRRKL